MSENLLPVAAVAVLAAAAALILQISRLNRLLESEYPEVYAPFHSMWGDAVFNPVLRFIRSGLHTAMGDPELTGLCRSVQILLVTVAWLMALAAFIGVYLEK